MTCHGRKMVSGDCMGVHGLEFILLKTNSWFPFGRKPLDDTNCAVPIPVGTHPKM
jgi:hypothetical protein